MNSYQTHTSTKKIKKNISEYDLVFFRERQRNKLYDTIISEFMQQSKESGLTKAALAKMLNKDPAQITRWFSSSSNWTLDTISDLLFAINNSELKFEVHSLLDHPKKNFTQIDNINSTNESMNTSTSETTYQLNISNA